MGTDRLLFAQRQNGLLGGLPLKGLEIGAAEFGEVICTFGRREQDSRTRLMVSFDNGGCVRSTNLADGREHVDGRPEVSDVKDRQVKLDVAVVTRALCRVFSTGQARRALLVRPLG